jgi:hypothetical protein
MATDNVDDVPNPAAGSPRQGEGRPRFTVLPPGISAEEAARLLQEWAQRKASERPADADNDA